MQVISVKNKAQIIAADVRAAGLNAEELMQRIFILPG
jgi:hypothetical protein